MSLIDDDTRAVALARAIISDIVLYNETALEAPVRQPGDLLARIDGPIAEGRQMYDARIDVDRVSPGHFERALDELLVARAKLDPHAAAKPGDFSSIALRDGMTTLAPEGRGAAPQLAALVAFAVILVLAIVVFLAR